MRKNILSKILLLGMLAWLCSCKDTLEEYNQIINVDNDTDLFQKLSADANLSKFTEFVLSTGYDKVLTSAQTYTVWAPTNAALASLDASISADPAKLKDFVANHIALTSVVTPKGTDTLKAKLLNNKYATLVGATFEEAAITGATQYVKNGALNTIDKAVPTKQNIWDYMLTSTDAPNQSAFISGLSSLVIDSANATIIGYDINGKPLYGTNPPMVSKNTYLLNVANLQDENQKFTFFMLQDPAFLTERTKILPYFPGFSSLNVVPDLTVKGKYTLDKLPDTLLSVRGVKVPITKSAIVKSYTASNGIVYVVSALPFRVKDKVPVVKIEGEKPFAFRSDRSGNTLSRSKLDNLGIPYKDIEVYNHAVAEYWIQYNVPNLPVVKYKVYARAISGAAGDSQVAAFTQRYFIFNPTTLVYDLFATQAVAPLTYTEVYLGDFTPQQLGTLNLRLTAANSTSVNVNTLILDYLRLEPILP